MNRLHRIVAAFLLFATAMLSFTSSAFAAYPSSLARTTPQAASSNPPSSSRSGSTPTASSSQQSSSRSGSAPNVIRYRNGTTVTYSNGVRFIQPHGRHAQPMIQRRDEKGRWMKAEPAKTWSPPATTSK